MKKDIFFEGTLINRAGVDRVVLGHVKLIDIDRSKLESAATRLKDIIFDDFKVSNRTFYSIDGGDRFHYLSIRDPEIGSINFGANPRPYGIYEFSPSNWRTGINLVNFSGDDLLDFLYHVESLFNERYGLTISFTASTLKEIELNTTFALQHDFNGYYRPLDVLFGSLPYLKKSCVYNGTEENTKKLQSCSAFNKQTSVTAYNKKVEMAVNLKVKGEITIVDENGVIVESDLMRVEFKLKTADVCKKWLLLDTIVDITNEIINRSFENLVNHYLFSSLEKWEINNYRYLNRLVRSYIINGKKGSRWKSTVLTTLRNEEIKYRRVRLLDVKDLNEVISKYSDKSGHRARLLLAEDFSGFADKDVFLNHDREKLNEIVESLKYAIYCTK